MNESEKLKAAVFARYWFFENQDSFMDVDGFIDFAQQYNRDDTLPKLNTIELRALFNETLKQFES